MPFASTFFSSVIVYTHGQRCREDLCIILYRTRNARYTVNCNSTENDTLAFTKQRTKGRSWPGIFKQNLISRALSTQALCHDRVKTCPLHCLTTARHTQTYRMFLPRSISTCCRPEIDSRGLLHLADKFTHWLGLVIKQAGVSTKWILYQGFCIPGSFEMKMDFFF